MRHQRHHYRYRCRIGMYINLWMRHVWRGQRRLSNEIGIEFCTAEVRYRWVCRRSESECFRDNEGSTYVTALLPVIFPVRGTSSPSVSSAGSIFTVAKSVTISVKTYASAKACPGHALQEIFVRQCRVHDHHDGTEGPHRVPMPNA